MYYAPATAAAETVVKYESPPVGKFGSGDALRVRLEKGDGCWWVACYKSFSPCGVIPESGYPFSGSLYSPATIKLLLLAHSFIRATADRIYFVVARRGSRKRIASSDKGCGDCNCCSFRTDTRGQSERRPDSTVNIRLISLVTLPYIAHFILHLSLSLSFSCR